MVFALFIISIFSPLMSEEAWVELFNGKDFTGWEQKGGTAPYIIRDGAIVGTSKLKTPNSFLCTSKIYSNFILELEYKQDARLNSGVQFRSNSVADYKKGVVHGYQYELENVNQNRFWTGGIYDEQRRGWIYPSKDNKELAAKFAEQGKRLTKKDDWNKLRIEAKGKSIKTYLNGELRADLEDGVTLSGFIALQVHSVGDKDVIPMEVQWRNIRIIELDNDSVIENLVNPN